MRTLRPRPGAHSLDEVTEEARVLLQLIPEHCSWVDGVEVGTLRGKTASILLHRRPGLHLTVVDDFSIGGLVEDDSSAVYQAAKRHLGIFGDRCELLSMPSVEAAPHVADGSQDFVYLDAGHDYGSVRADVEAWWPKVRRGGFIAGHDYGREKPEGLPGEPWEVARAVHDWLAGRPLSLLLDSTWVVFR